MTRDLDDWLARLSRPALIGVAAAMVAALAAIDHATGFEISFSIFYLIPVATTAWYGSRGCGYAFALLSAVAWVTTDLAAGHTYSHFLIPYWNGVVRLGLFVIVAHLVAAQRRDLDRETASARTDALTGALNLAGFMQAAEGSWGLAIRYARPTTLAYFDLDDFKQINDRLGHEAGDQVLKATAAMLRTMLRSTDLLGRVGGDEFVALLPETDRDGAEAVLRKVHAELTRPMHGPVRPAAGVSIGIVVVNPPYPHLADAIKAADALMYRIKRGGKNGWSIEDWTDPAGDRPDDRSDTHSD